MNRQHLQELVRQQLGGTATPMAAELALNAVLHSIKEGLLQDGSVKLAHFGTFHIQQRAARRLLLPGSKKEMMLKPRHTVSFNSHE